MLAGVAAGVFSDLDEATAAMVSVGERYEPDPAAHDAYDAAYARYIELFEALRPLFDCEPEIDVRGRQNADTASQPNRR